MIFSPILDDKARNAFGNRHSLGIALRNNEPQSPRYRFLVHEASQPASEVCILHFLDRYYWRTPYTNMTEAEIVAHLQAAREFAFSDASPTDCLQSALGGGSAACCLSWAATKLEPDYLFSGVDDADGSIKVIELVPQRNKEIA